jgi:CRISPR-associated protein Cas2
LEQQRRIQKAALKTRCWQRANEGVPADLYSLKQRIEWIERFLHQQAPFRFDMLFFVMYDIEDHKVRRHVANYLKRNGCLRMQKSVFIGQATQKTYQSIAHTLAEINAMYQNGDSILVLPITQETITRLQVIGKEVNYRMVTNPPRVVII